MLAGLAGLWTQHQEVALILFAASQSTIEENAGDTAEGDFTNVRLAGCAGTTGGLDHALLCNKGSAISLAKPSRLHRLFSAPIEIVSLQNDCTDGRHAPVCALGLAV